MFLLVFIQINGRAQTTSQNKVKAVFIYNFTKYITWPADDKIEEFTIAVLGKNNSGLDSALRANLGSKKINGFTENLQLFESHSFYLDKKDVFYIFRMDILIHLMAEMVKN